MTRLAKDYWFFVRLILLLSAIIGVSQFWPTAKRLNNERTLQGDFSVRDGKLGSLLYLNDKFLGCWVGDFSDAGCPAIALKHINPEADLTPSSKIEMGSCSAVVDDYLTTLTRKRIAVIVSLECDKHKLVSFSKDALKEYRAMRDDRIFKDGKYLAYFLLMIIFKNDLIALIGFAKKIA